MATGATTVISERARATGRSIGRTGAEALFLKVLLFAIGFIGSVVVSRALGPEGRGLYYLPVVAASTVVALAKLGLQNANLYLFGTRGISPDRLAGQNGLVAIVMGSLGALVLVEGPVLLPSVFAQTPLVLLLVAAVTVPFSMHQQFSAGLLNLQGVVTWQFRASLISGTVQLAALIGLAMAGRLDPLSVLVVNTVAIVFTWGLTQLAFAPSAAVQLRIDAALLRETLANSLILHLAMVLFFLHLRLDTYMVQVMAGTTALGQYSVAITLAETILLASDSLGVSLLPRLATDSLRESALLALRGSRINVIISVTLGAGWAVAGYWVITLFYGPAFAPGFLPLLALLPGMTALGVQRCTGGPVLRTGAPWKFAGIYGVSVLCNFLLNLLLIPTMGITGAAIASSVSYSVEAFFFISWVARIGGTGISAGLIPQREDLGRILSAAREGIRTMTRLVSRPKVLGTRHE